MKIAPKEYKKDLNYSYASGVFATLELLKSRPQDVIRVFLNKQGRKNKGLDKIEDLCRKNSIPTEWADGLVVKISHSENCYALGVFNKYQTKVNEGSSHVVLVNPSDMGNLGTIIRTMVGFGFKDLIIIRPGADIYDPKVIRASVGSFFKINFQYFSDFKDYQKAYPQNKIYTFMLNGSKDLSEINFQKPCSFVFGPEGEGLKDEYQSYGQAVKISHSNEIDSLNLSIAVGITLYKAKS